MAKRPPMPKAVRDKVLKEFNHRCAKCGDERPQVHHIDEDPTNNDPLNLIPLCPNCHLTDQHDASNAIPQAKLRFFRRYKHKRILSPRFNSLHKRMAFLDDVATSNASELEDRGQELIKLVEQLQMGSFFAGRLKELLTKPHTFSVWVVGDEESWRERQEQRQRDDAKYVGQVAAAKLEIESLVVELLDHQDWP